MKPLACINGKFVFAARASISIFDRGFLYGDGVFETLRVYHGKIFRLPQHLWRLKSGLETLKIRSAPDPDRLADAVRALVARNRIGEGLIRILITRGLGEVGLETNRARPPVIPGETSPRRGAGDPLWVIYAQEKPPRLESEYHHGWRVITSSIPKNAQSWLERTKTISRVHHVMAKAEAEAAGVNDAVMLNTNGHLTEGTTSNLFLIKRGRLLTPPISDGLLGGITRAAILELAHHLRLPAQEIHLRSRHLYSADEAFLTSTLLEIMPITEADGRKISRGHIGPLTARLRREFRELVRRELGVDVPAIRG